MLALETMSIRSQLKDSVPDPKGSMSSRLPSQAIAPAIKEVEKVSNSVKGKKRGEYTWIMDQQGSKRVEVAGLRSKSQA